ncbi:DHA2 family efflux MFS transporter permease subunit [Leucobacter luti]|uniref:EmrB/QacA subfamily drug resistance transporter n=1 Tax=Leucobacter luti TaxID=340320 RepID=A0A4Q7TQ85_9MICO|nr:DHA2 family efflux MFS transporter permease subunit [Leucobacter luti]MBL3699763.1 DHA2 family efflux MFS transporter permease subunit [Leucobacter luti]RZT62916.1 EmrB/QacA subfamily drug resistance transporter [Leucobacter luti]
MTAVHPAAPSGALLTGRAKHLALAGLFLSMFVSMLAMNVVGTSMPIIIADIGGTQAAFTWVVTATMLASAISTPIWGKLADLTSKKALLQIALIVFTLGSALAGTAQDPTWLIVFRVLQGLGAGGLGVLGQIVLAEVVSPLERGKYMGIMGAVMAVATVGGPLLGGLITDTIGWRWNFYVAAPIAIVAIIMLQRTLHLQTFKQKIKIDYLGAALISAGFTSLLIWVTLGGSNFDWWSWQTIAMVGGGLIVLALAVFVETRAEEPLIPLTLFKNRTFTLAVVASIAVGLAMFGTAVFLGQYMQLARGRTVIEASLLTLPMMAGVLISSTIVGQIITRTGKWKRYMVIGAVALLAGLLLMGQLRYDTSYWYVGVSMFIMGAGVGMTMQNLVLVVQNTVPPTQMGVASSSVTFFRTIGGTAGMSAMGAMLAAQVSSYIQDGLAKLAPEQLAGAESLASGVLPKVAELPEPIRLVVESAYGHSIGNIFFAASPIALLALVAIIFLPNVPLSTKSNAEKIADLRAAEEANAEGVLTGSVTVLTDTTGPVVLPTRHSQAAPSTTIKTDSSER